MGCSHIVGVVWCGAAVMYWGTPSIAMYFIVVCVHVAEVRVVVVAYKCVVGRHCPIEVGGRHRAAEAKILCSAVHLVAIGVV